MFKELYGGFTTEVVPGLTRGSHWEAQGHRMITILRRDYTLLRIGISKKVLGLG